MHYINAQNVNEAYKRGLNVLAHFGEKQPSRAGDVLVMPHPVTTRYRNPRQRVLFDALRDANPFFHLMESLWMLAGRNDATWLDQFVSDFSKRFAESEGIQHGAYGFRWRTHFMLDGNEDDPKYGFELDQLERIVTMLKRDPFDRRVVLQMWDPEIDLGANVKDVPCNLTVLPRIIHNALDITVFCRSNDAIWGAYGANAVHFSVLQEYLAARVGVSVGDYYQISNNFHAYTNIFNKKATPAWLEAPVEDPYSTGEAKVTQIVTEGDAFDEDLRQFFNNPTDTNPPVSEYKNKFFDDIAVPMFNSYKRWREGDKDAARSWLLQMPHDSDWKLACEQWYDRRTPKE